MKCLLIIGAEQHPSYGGGAGLDRAFSDLRRLALAQPGS